MEWLLSKTLVPVLSNSNASPSKSLSNMQEQKLAEFAVQFTVAIIIIISYKIIVNLKRAGKFCICLQIIADKIVSSKGFPHFDLSHSQISVALVYSILWFSIPTIVLYVVYDKSQLQLISP